MNLGGEPGRTCTNNQASATGANEVADVFAPAWPAQLGAVFGRSVASRTVSCQTQMLVAPSLAKVSYFLISMIGLRQANFFNPSSNGVPAIELV